MHFSAVAVTIALVGGASTAMASAIPAITPRQATLCTGSYSAVCCATDVLGLADLNCAPRTFPTTSSQRLLSSTDHLR